MADNVLIEHICYDCGERIQHPEDEFDAIRKKGYEICRHCFSKIDIGVKETIRILKNGT